MQSRLKLVLAVLFLLLGSLFLSGCGQDGAWRYDPGIPDQVAGVAAEPGNRLVTLSWTGNPKATSYVIYYVSGLDAGEVTKANGTRIVSTTTSRVIDHLDNNIAYHFMVTAINKDGESKESLTVSAAPGPISGADLTGVWYFHTLVSGPDARWERGTLTVAADGSAVVSDFLDSSGSSSAPAGFQLQVDGSGVLSQSGVGAWVDFHGSMGSRKNMMLGSWSAGLKSSAITVFQRKKSDAARPYSIEDIAGTGSGQNTSDPYLQGNGPTRFVYHQLYSGASTQWEYCNAKVGQHGNIWTDEFKDIIYWDFSNPQFKTLTFDFLWKATSVGVAADGVVTEYWNFSDVVNPPLISSFNGLVPTVPHDVVFTGRMSADRSVVVGVGTRRDAGSGNPQYFMKIWQLCFIPTDQALPLPGLVDLAGSYQFVRLAAGGAANAASWAHGTLDIALSGMANYAAYADSTGNAKPPAGSDFSLAYYPDVNPDLKLYRDFANFTGPAQDGYYHYHDAGGNALQSYFDFTSFGSTVGNPASWRREDISGTYYNEHASLSYNRDLLVLTRTEGAGDGMLIGLK